MSPGGHVFAEHIWNGRSGSTNFTTPSYTDYDLVFGTVCAEFRVYHSSTVGQNLVDVAQSCAG